MGRKRKRVIRIFQKQLPKIYFCPQCGKESITIEVFREKEYATITCGDCKLTGEILIKPAYQVIDIYCQFVDNFYLNLLNV